MLKTFIDAGIINRLLQDKAVSLNFLERTQETYQLDWPSLFLYLGQETLLENLSAFDLRNPLFASMTALLHASDNEEVIIHSFDRVFAEFLTLVKVLPQVQVHFLLEQIRKKQEGKQRPIDTVLALPLHDYQRRFEKQPADTLHDLVLYLAWDRVCAFFGAVFDYQTLDDCFSRGLIVLKKCLIESFLHITEQGRTKPGVFRLLEAFYAYEMREERLQTHTNEEWQALCESSKALRSREALSSVCYIDQALVKHEKADSSAPALRVYTLDPEAQVKAGYSLAHHIFKRILQDDAAWNYSIAPVDLICLRQTELELSR